MSRRLPTPDTSPFPTDLKSYATSRTYSRHNTIDMDLLRGVEDLNRFVKGWTEAEEYLSSSLD